MGSTDEKSLELEVKHKVNGSWHPCSVSLSTHDSKFGIIVDFANSDEQDIISNREDAIARLRFRSTTLHDGECSHIKEGDCVLAMYKDQFKSTFFDAMIEKPNRVKHSKRVFCRCTFEIKWLNPELKEETMIIPSKSILRLSTTEIVSHPIVAAFLNSLSPTDGAEASSFLSLLEETSYEEVDVEGILEKQIEEISKLADGSMDYSTDLFEVKRGSFGGQKQSKGAVSANHNQSNRRRSTRSQNKEPVEVEPKKVVEDDKPFLSPLAACAALASLIHEQEPPMKIDLSFSPLGQEYQEYPVPKDSTKQIKMHSRDKHRYGVKDNRTVNNSISSTNVSGRSTMTRVTRSSAPNKEVEVLSDEVKCQSFGKKLTSPSNSTRKTRATRHQETEDSSDESKEEYSIENTRLTQARNLKGRSNTHGMPEGKKGSSSTIVNNSIDLTSAPSTAKRGLSSSSMHKEIEAPSDAMKPTAKRVTRSSLTKEIEASSDAVKPSTNKEIEASSDAVKPKKTRVTRSLGNKEIEASSDGVKQESSSSKVIGSTARSTRTQNQMIEITQDTIEEVEAVITPGKSESKTRSNKRIRTSQDVTVTTEESGAILEDDEKPSTEKKNSKRKKVIASEKPMLRSSPRFDSLPRARSQK